MKHRNSKEEAMAKIWRCPRRKKNRSKPEDDDPNKPSVKIHALAEKFDEERGYDDLHIFPTDKAMLWAIVEYLDQQQKKGALNE